MCTAEETYDAEDVEAERLAAIARVESRADQIIAQVQARDAENTLRRWSRDHGTRELDHMERQAGEAAVAAPW